MYNCQFTSLSLSDCKLLDIRDRQLSFSASLVAQMVKNLPTMQETQVRTLGQEDTPETGVATATHADVVAWELPQTEEPGELQDSAINTHFQPCVEQSVTHRMYSKTC